MKDKTAITLVGVFAGTWAVICLGAGGTLVYFLIRALAKYVGE